LLKPIDSAQLRVALRRALGIRRLNTTLSLYEASRALLGTLERQELIRVILELSQRTLRASAAGLALVPPEGNPAAAQIFGWSHEQTVGRKLMDFAIPSRLVDAFR
jgi:PAS domain-containing protein